MSREVSLRELGNEDLDAASALACAALPAPRPPDADWPERERGRIAHLLATDPGGAWVAVEGERIIGVTVTVRRGGLWGGSLLAVAPDRQGQGVGSLLFDRQLEYAGGTSGAILVSSMDPRGMHRYINAGFRLLPCVAATGTVERRRIPTRLDSRASELDASLPLIEAVSTETRGAGYGPDVAALVATGGRLLVVENGFAVVRAGSPLVLAATDERAAEALLWGCLADSPEGGEVAVDFISGPNFWAARVADSAGLRIEPFGPICVRGQVGPLASYLPNPYYL
jgi:GNAT superfamily N-acetyltransferase